MGSVSRRIGELEAAVAGRERSGPLPDAILRRGDDGVVRDSRGEAVDVEAAVAAWAQFGVRVHVLSRAQWDRAERDAIRGDAVDEGDEA